MGDTHCGHFAGLTPPSWWQSKKTKWGISERESWGWFTSKIKKHGPYDAVIANADLIAGQNKKHAGVQLITTDRNQQVSMAMMCLEETKCKKFRLTYGTPYHTGKEEDFELTLTKRLVDKGYDAQIDAEGFYNVNGVIISAKHHAGGSAQEPLRGTPLRKELFYNDQWVQEGIQPRADVIVRGHTHYFDKEETVNRHAFSCPALCTLGDKFGARICKGTVHFGFLTFNISAYGEFTYKKHIEVLASQPDYAEVI